MKEDSVNLQRRQTPFVIPLVFILCFLSPGRLLSQSAAEANDHGGYVPVISGGAGYVQNIAGGVNSLEPQVDPVLLVPFGRHFLLESRTDFTGFFQRENQTSGPYKGKVFKDVEFAQLDWLADSHVTVVGGRYLLPFGLYNERLEPLWIRNLQDFPYSATIGTRTSGAGVGLMLRGVAVQTPRLTAQYSAYFSARSGINQFSAARTAGADGSVFLTQPRVEIGASWQRFLQDRHINNTAAYVSWQPHDGAFDVKAEYDYSYFGRGYWIELAYRLKSDSAPRVLQNFQPVVRMEELFPLHGGGNGLPQLKTKRPEFGLNYYLRDNVRLVSSYGRSFSSSQNMNLWNFGVTYRFTIPLWFGGTK